MKREEVHAVFERDDPAVEQVTRADLLSSKVIDQQNAAIGFYLERRFIEFMDFIVDKVQVLPGSTRRPPR